MIAKHSNKNKEKQHYSTVCQDENLPTNFISVIVTHTYSSTLLVYAATFSGQLWLLTTNMTTSNKIKWTSEQVNHLLHAMKGYRPYGLEKHFHMMFILEKFRARSGLSVGADVLWDFIEEHYNIDLLTERELEEFKKKQVDYSTGGRKTGRLDP